MMKIIRKEKDQLQTTTTENHEQNKLTIIDKLMQANNLNFSHFALDNIGKLMTIWTIRNERVEGYFYTIDPQKGNCIFQCIKSTEEGGNKIIKKRFQFTDILFISQQSEDHQIATYIDRQHNVQQQQHLCRNRSRRQEIMIDEEISIGSRQMKKNRQNDQTMILEKYNFIDQNNSYYQQQQLQTKDQQLSYNQAKIQSAQNELVNDMQSLQQQEQQQQQSQEEQLMRKEITLIQEQQELENIEEEKIDRDELIERMFNDMNIIIQSNQQSKQQNRIQLQEFNENDYTTQLNLMNISRELYLSAEALQYEVYSLKSENIHLQDDRNDQNIFNHADDNLLYSTINRKVEKNEKYNNKETQDDFSTKANSTQDSMRPDSAKSEQSLQKAGQNLKSKGKKLRLTNNTFEPPINHATQNERFQTNKMVYTGDNFNLQDFFLERFKSNKDQQIEYIEEKQITQDCSWRSFLSDQKKDNILLFNSLMTKSCHTSSGSSIGSRISNGFRQNNTKINHNKFNQFFNQAALAMSLNLQSNLNNTSFSINNVTQNLNLSNSNLNNSFNNINNNGNSNNNNNGNNSNGNNNNNNSSVNNGNQNQNQNLNNSNNSNNSSNMLSNILNNTSLNQSSYNPADQFNLIFNTSNPHFIPHKKKNNSNQNQNNNKNTNNNNNNINNSKNSTASNNNNNNNNKQSNNQNNAKPNNKQ